MGSRFVLAKVARWLERHLVLAFAVWFLLVALALWGSLNLRVNTNQLKLLPQDLEAVKEAHRVSEMTGGIGFLMLALKARDTRHLKAVADDLAARLSKMPEMREVRFKLETDWVLERIAMWVETTDLLEARRRLKAKIKDVVRKANPFHIELRKTEPVKLDLSDLIDKYRELGKKGVEDDYYITRDKKMVLLLLKPIGDSTDLAFTSKLLGKVERLIAAYNRSNRRGAVLREGYRTLARGATVTYGYTGGYKLNLDDSESIIQSLIPTSVVSGTGILLLLLLFLRRVVLVLGLMLSLVSGVIMTFGYGYLTVGELNSITAILAGILMGQGIDFGIQFIYRVREEYTRRPDLPGAIEVALQRLGAAALTTAASVAAAFFALSVSSFKGFRDFGIMAGGGTFIIAACMLCCTAMILHLLHRLWPGYLGRVLTQRVSRRAEARRGRPIPAIRPVLWGGLAVSAGLFVTATGYPEVATRHLPPVIRQGVTFNYDSRALMVKDRPSIVLQQEIKDRYQISADPAAVYTPTLEEARALFHSMNPLDPERFSTVDAVISLFLFVPPREQQEANVRILAQIKKDLEPISPSMLEPKERRLYNKLLPYLEARPFVLADVPEKYQRQFRNVPESRVKGYLTFIYPKVALWDSRDLLAFSDQVAELRVRDRTYHSTGMAILYARLAEIVLGDGKLFTLLAALAILLILLVDLRSLVATLVTLLPLVAGVIWMLGLMALLGQQINFMNIVVFPVVLGYGMGNGIYIFHRFRESGSARLALSQTGRAVLASCTTTLVGWSSLLTANHLGLESMGVLSSLGIGCVLITSLVLLPALLQLLQSWFVHRLEHREVTT